VLNLFPDAFTFMNYDRRSVQDILFVCISSVLLSHSESSLLPARNLSGGNGGNFYPPNPKVYPNVFGLIKVFDV